MTPVFFLPPLFLPHLWNLRRSPCRPPAEILRFDRHQSRPRTRVRSKNGVPQKEVIARLKSRKAKLGSVVGEVLLFPTTEDMERIIRVIGGSDST